MFQVIDDKPNSGQVEFVEKKGRGHPDSIADALAELISYEYSRYCLEKFGMILHHHFDKLVVLGGESRVAYGAHEQVRPIQVVLNGRASRIFGNSRIPMAEIARQAVSAYLPTVLPGVKDAHWELIDNTSPVTGSSAKGWHWWAPRHAGDIPELYIRRANDTSVCVASAPHTILEARVIEAEQSLFDRFVVSGQCGSDLKILAVRVVGDLSVTACVPILSAAVTGPDDYDAIKEAVTIHLRTLFSDTPGISRTTVDANTRDNSTTGDLYMLGLGTAAEHGDHGAVGRGNRSSGLITTETPMSVEASWGKNPTYYTGLVYDACARIVSRAVHGSLGVANTTYLASRNGRAIADPWVAMVRVPPGTTVAQYDIGKAAEEAFHRAYKISTLMDDIRRRYPHLAEMPDGLSSSRSRQADTHDCRKDRHLSEPG